MNMPTEHAEQAAVVTWLRTRKIKFFAVPNGAKMGRAEAAKMKREGMESGVPDLFVVDRGVKLAIEMKKRDGAYGDVSASQRDWLTHLQTQGFTCVVAYGAEEAIAHLRANILGGE